jgi:hypothetical protein
MVGARSRIILEKILAMRPSNYEGQGLQGCSNMVRIGWKRISFNMKHSRGNYRCTGM